MKPLINTAQPSAGTNAFSALKGASGNSGPQRQVIGGGSLPAARARQLSSAGTPDVINAVFPSDTKSGHAMTHANAFSYTFPRNPDPNVLLTVSAQPITFSIS